MRPVLSTAGRISPLLDCGNAYSSKFPIALIDGVMAGCEGAVGVPLEPVVGDDVEVSPHGASSNVRSSKIGKYFKGFINLLSKRNLYKFIRYVLHVSCAVHSTTTPSTPSSTSCVRRALTSVFCQSRCGWSGRPSSSTRT